MLPSRPWLVLALLPFLSLLQSARADGPKETGPKGVDFNRQIRPILSENCFACHGPDEKGRKAKLRLDTKEGAFAKLRDGGLIIAPGKAGASELVHRISAKDEAELMPPPKSGKKLTPEQIALLKKWVDEGAIWSTHWAFVSPTKAPLPAVTRTAWPRNPIDHFVLARLEKEGLEPAPEADRSALLRRVTFDLTGLPPTLPEIDAFLADQSAQAYEKAVDRLLRSPRYGEHMARFWLDAARYGDTHGMHLDNYREIWPYRDWVIRAFNNNTPFDRFLVEQLAGDLLPGSTLEQKVATGFIRCHVTTNEGGSIDEEVYVRNVVDRVDTNGIVLLGLTTGCARCHDHRYDPVSMKEYYQLFAFFNNLDGAAQDGNIARHPPILQMPTPEQAAALSKVQDKIAGLQKQVAEELAKVKYEEASTPQGKGSSDSLASWLQAQRGAGGAKLPKELQPVVKLDPAKQSPAQKKQMRDYFLQHVHSKTRLVFAPLNAALTAAAKERDNIDKDVPATLVFKERGDIRPAYILKRGEYDQRGPQVERSTPAFLPPLPTKAPRDRLGFAQWLTAGDHPLTARVAVNRFWQQCFGTGLVKTTEDFGSQGEPPSHPELLDFLAVQFVAESWDVRKLMRHIVTSASYRQSARITKDRLAKDPHNRLLSRGPRFRLDAEMLRDQALFVSGLLVEKVGGPSVKPPQPAGLWEAVAFTGSNTGKFSADTGHDKVHRRSMYIFWKRTAAPPQMNAFDAPSRESCTVRRERTNTPLQALLLMNEQQFVEAARALGERSMKQGGPGSEERLRFLFRSVTARAPEAAELSELRALLTGSLKTFQANPKAADQLISVGELRPDPTLNPAELAAWTMVANLVLNLDEVISR